MYNQIKQNNPNQIKKIKKINSKQSKSRKSTQTKSSKLCDPNHIKQIEPMKIDQNIQINPS